VTRRALVVGAGIGGLAAGIALRRAGWDVEIFERADEARELGFGLLLAPNALAALAELGIPAAIVGGAPLKSGAEIRRLNGDVIRRFRVQLGGPAVVALRPDLFGALLATFGAGLSTGRDVTDVRDGESGAELTLSAGERRYGTILVGADGVASIVRRHLHPEEFGPRPSGYFALRGVATGAGAALGDLSAAGYLDDGIEVGVARASKDAIYWYMSLLARDLGPEERTPAAVLLKLRPRLDRTLSAIVSATAPGDMRLDELFIREPLSTWGRGRVTLLGDAAHPVLPHTGQGAALAMEDAVALGLALSRPGAAEARLREYERVRSARTRPFQRLGPRIARVTTTHSVLIQRMRALAIRLAPERLLGKSIVNASQDPHAALR
jgi:2-polyprenyl-6-methoxyphenol hydroxylase-like FAD-dependent oxidoreductase